jgi:hypothetical protein
MSEVRLLLVLVVWASSWTLDPHFLREPIRMQVHPNDRKSYDLEILHLPVGSYYHSTWFSYHPCAGWYLLWLIWRLYLVLLDVLRLRCKKFLLLVYL